MLHSNIQKEREEDEKKKKLETQVEYARQNREYVSDKRDQLNAIKAGQLPAETIARKPLKKTYCCWGMLILMLVCAGVIYYFFSSIKDAMYEDYRNKKQFIIEQLPQGKVELQKSLDQGAQLIDETKNTAQKIQDNLDKVSDAYDTGKDALKAGNEAVNKVEALKEDLSNLVK